MANLKFADTHNMVAFLSKPEESDGFEQIVDFLNAQPIRYALTVNPTIYTSCIEQFWSTVKAKTINGEVQLHALVDGKKIIITESIIRRDLQLEDAEDEAVHKELGDSLVRAATTASSLEAEQENGNITKTRSKATPNESSSLGTTSGGGPRCQETIGDTIAQTKFENVSKLSNDPMFARDITLVNVQDDAEMFDVNTLTGDEVFTEQEVAAKDVNLTIDEVTLAQELAALKNVKSKDKGKGIMVEEPVKTIKKKDLIRLDEETAKRLQAEFDEEERLAREKDEANVALIKEWDAIQDKIKADHELAQRLQAEEQEELFVEEKAKLFRQFLEQKRKHFVAKSAEEKMNKPPTQAQQKKSCKMFDRAFMRVNTFVDFRTDLVEGSSKRAGEELEQKSTKKQKVDEDKDTTWNAPFQTHIFDHK
ncbi:hypothetical protein Tco_0196173 [Tanacetum coccineum]